MSGFSARKQIADAWETEVLNRLQKEGWTADKFGQGLLPERQRKLLMRVNTDVRWMPDIIAHKIVGDPFSFVPQQIASCYMDAKAGERFMATGNHDIETRSLKVLLEWQRFSGCPVFVVTKDWKVHKVDAIEAHCWDGPFCGVGSGTPFKLWSATATDDGINIPWESVMVLGQD